MTARLIREFLIDLAVFLAVAVVTSFVGFFAYLILPSLLFSIGLMALTAAILGVVIQRRVWAERLRIQRIETVQQAEAQWYEQESEEPEEW